MSSRPPILPRCRRWNPCDERPWSAAAADSCVQAPAAASGSKEVEEDEAVEGGQLAAVGFALSASAPGTDGYLYTWGGVGVEDVAVTAERITVTLSGPGPSDVDDETARISVQQLVWTAQGAVGQGPIPVRFVVADPVVLDEPAEAGDAARYATATAQRSYAVDLAERGVAYRWLVSAKPGVDGQQPSLAPRGAEMLRRLDEARAVPPARRRRLNGGRSG